MRRARKSASGSIEMDRYNGGCLNIPRGRAAFSYILQLHLKCEGGIRRMERRHFT